MQNHKKYKTMIFFLIACNSVPLLNKGLFLGLPTPYERSNLKPFKNESKWSS